ncbi:MAG TPA: hypothetical protein VJ895_01025, partial [Candidatus Nanoarchaeia archaeon]|nr:hypothetical protein [Candidatus Nanoarchaeia archaeon]
MERKNWHDKNYKKLLVIPAIIILFSVFYLISFNSQNGEFMKRDISLTGGTSITVFEKTDITNLELALKDELPDLTIRTIYELRTSEQKAFVIETTADSETAKKVVEDFLEIDLIEGENADIISTGSMFGEDFYKQLLIAILVAFVFMAIVILIIFKTAVPSLAVIISAFANILMTLVTFNLLGMKMS